MIKSNVKHIISDVAEHTKSLCVVFFALFSVASALLLIGTVFRHLVDKGLSADRITEIHSAILIIIFLISIFALGSFFRSYFINVITIKVTSKLKSSIYRSLMQVDIEKYENLKVGDIVSRLGSDIESIGSLITNFLSFFVRNFIMLLGGLVLMFIQSPKLSLLVIASLPVLLFPLLKLSRIVRAMSRAVLEKQGELSANIDESFLGIRTLYAYNQQNYFADIFDDKVKSYIDQASRRQKLRSMFFALAISVISGAIISVVWIGSIDIIYGKMSSGQMVSFIYYAIIVGMSAGGIAELFSEVQGPLAALDRVMELKDMVADQKLYEEGNNLDKDLSITFDSVKFSYPARPDIAALNKISLKFQQGKFIGVVGQSGSGKSTIMQLLLKFYDYGEGGILIGGIDIRAINSDEIRQKIAYVEQFPTIFSGTIKSNIAFANPNADDKKINEISDLCGINEFANNFEYGLDTEIGERGVRISGGQKQRIAIARALLYNPEILMLDEATSALDNESEKVILKNVKAFLKEKTIISIAHRISSIEKADEIYVINHGKVESCGRHEELLKSSKTYSLLYKKESKSA